MITHAIIDQEADTIRLYPSEEAMFQDAAYMLNCSLAAICTVKNDWIYAEVKEVESVRNSLTECFLLTEDEKILTGPSRGAYLHQREWGIQLEDFDNPTVWQIIRTLEIQILMQCERKPRFQLLDRVAGRC